MEIKQLQPKQSNVEITLDVVDVGEPREFQKFGKSGRVATAETKDSNGDTIKLTLWNEDIDKVKSGDKVRLSNGYVSEWQGELQLTTGRYGKLEVIEKVDTGSESQKEGKEEDMRVYRNYDPKEDKETLKGLGEEPYTDEESIDEI